jgi:hypothetical protein
MPTNGFARPDNRQMTANGNKRKKKKSPLLNTSNSHQASVPMF